MIKGGIGSASIVLVFAVLCLAIFAVISLVPALTSQNLIDAEVRLVQDFFAADALAEQIIDEIIYSTQISENILGIDIFSYWSEDLVLAYFAIPISQTQILYVEIGLHIDFLEIFSWRMYNVGEWIADESINIWQGDFWRLP